MYGIQRSRLLPVVAIQFAWLQFTLYGDIYDVQQHKRKDSETDVGRMKQLI